jgi:hypothetical protein
MDIKFACHACGQHLAIDISCGGSTRNCPTCSTPLLIPQLVTQPIPPKNQRSLRWGLLKQRRLAWSLFSGAIALGALIIVAHLISVSSPNVRGRQAEARAAYLAAKQFCMQYAPRATNFTCDPKMPDYDHKGLWCSNIKPPHWTAMGCIDCERRYGASRSNLRQLWVAELVQDGESWNLNRLSIGRDTLYESH